jgi:allantoin racemase
MSVPAISNPADIPLRLLWVNPINDPLYDQPIADLIAQVKMPLTEVHVVSLDLGSSVNLTNLEWRAFESKIWFPVTAISWYANQNRFDGYSIGCFYDTALDEAREVSGQAVVCGPCQSALHAVSNLCNRFSIIIGVEEWTVQMRDRVRHYGYIDQLASFRPVGLHVDDFQKDPAKTEAMIRAAVKAAIEIDKAEAIILGCTIEFGFFRQLQEEFGVPVIDAVYACFKATENAALNAIQFGWTPSHMYSMERPDDARLTASGIFAGPAPIGNTIIVPAT